MNPNPSSVLTLRRSHRESNLIGRTGSRGLAGYLGLGLLRCSTKHRAHLQCWKTALSYGQVGIFFKLVLPVLLPLMRSINHWKKRKQHRASSFAHGPVFWRFFLRDLQWDTGGIFLPPLEYAEGQRNLVKIKYIYIKKKSCSSGAFAEKLERVNNLGKKKYREKGPKIRI